MALTFIYPTPLPSTKGWGAGWPNCQTDKIKPHLVFQGGVHQRIFELTNLLVAELEKKGYAFHDGWSWGYGCRGTKDSSGKTSGTPSFHSWGLALDFNAPINSFGAPRDKTQLGSPSYAWVVKLMKEYGFFWLGPAIGDWMHFSFCGSPNDADAMLAKAKANGLGKAPEPAYKVGDRVFRTLSSAMTFMRAQLKKGRDLVVRVIKR